MEKELMIFKNDKLGLKVRTIKNEDGSILINAYDTAVGFGWTQTEVKNGKKYITIKWSRVNGFIKELGFDHKCTKDDFIPESLFYMLGMKANNDVAKKFQQWLAIEVIPSIRKTGGYLGVTDDMSEKEILARALKITERTLEDKNKIIEMKNKQLEEQKPKVLFANAIIGSETSISVGDMSKLLVQNGVPDIGQQRLFEWFRNNGYVIKRNGGSRNVPTQYSMDLKLMELEESININENGQCYIVKQTKITPKGQKYFIEKFLKDTNQEVC